MLKKKKSRTSHNVGNALCLKKITNKSQCWECVVLKKKSRTSHNVGNALCKKSETSHNVGNALC